MPKVFIETLDKLKSKSVSKPLELNEGFLLLKLERVRSYKFDKEPSFFVIFSTNKKVKNNDLACSAENNNRITGPILLEKVKKPVRDILKKLMPGENYEISTNDGIEIISLCERYLKSNKKNEFDYEELDFD